jgi:threonine dehydrogenase-like Zn-dependent dehydrogenase
VRELVYVEPGKAEWRAAPVPRLEDQRDVIVRPVAASSCDLDRRIIRGKAPHRGPFALGHEAVAEVVEAGDECGSLAPGQLVVVTYNIACGACDRCRDGVTHSCPLVPAGAMYGLPAGGDWGGPFSDLVGFPSGPGR